MITLGLDSSTQSLTAMLIDAASGTRLLERQVAYADTFPEYGTDRGVLRLEDQGAGTVHAPPGMWLAALDRVLADLQAAGAPLDRVAAVAVSAQQHGSVYLNASWPQALASLDPARDLADQLAGVFSRATAPVWMDSSTTQACDEIRDALGGMEQAAALTGSDLFERFTGPQIRKFAVQDPDAYAATAHIALVSSFVTSVLAGKIVPIDPGDGSGMNLMELASLDWHPGALAATADALSEKLPPVGARAQDLGSLAPYFTARYGLPAEARVVLGSGDNPCSAVGLGLVVPGEIAISLGTSDTLFGIMEAPRTDPRGEGHVFASPAGGFMSLICFKNGSLARERVAKLFDLDWEGFNQALGETPPGNQGRIILPWFETEIVPRVQVAGIHRLGLAKDDRAAMCRAVVEAQMLAMRLHSQWMGETPRSILATGGASANRAILQIMANVFQCPVHRLETTSSAALGAALIAAHALNPEVSWTDLTGPFTRPSGDAVQPDPTTAPVYQDLLKTYADFEARALEAVAAFLDSGLG